MSDSDESLELKKRKILSNTSSPSTATDESLTSLLNSKKETNIHDSSLDLNATSELDTPTTTTHTSTVNDNTSTLTASMKQNKPSPILHLPASLSSLLLYPDLSLAQDSVLSLLCDFLLRHIGNRSEFELEAKFGSIVDKSSQCRIQLPILNEAVLMDGHQFRFESNMIPERHQFFNQSFNRIVESSASSSSSSSSLPSSSIENSLSSNTATNTVASVTPSFPHLTYQRRMEIDRFYSHPNMKGPKIRVTFNENNEVMNIIQKERIADMNIFFPNSPFDVRISLNVEHKVENIPTGVPLSSRKKNRLSYKLGDQMQIDLTQVESSDNPNVKSHELELEWMRPKDLITERNKLINKETNRFEPLVKILLGNIRQICFLARNVPK